LPIIEDTMTLTSFASVLACILFICAMLHVVATDLMHRRIRNWLVAAMAALYPPLALAAGLPAAEIAMGSVAALLVFVAGFGCFAAGWIGGGDAKLAPVCVLWLGAEQALPFLALTSLFGGILALALVVTGALRRADGAHAAEESRSGLPYGPAIAIAALTLLPHAPWTDAL
jgi:prepilin peptidase CpaA